jgi:hypothetical protein
MLLRIPAYIGAGTLGSWSRDLITHRTPAIPVIHLRSSSAIIPNADLTGFGGGKTSTVKFVVL